MATRMETMYGVFVVSTGRLDPGCFQPTRKSLDHSFSDHRDTIRVCEVTLTYDDGKPAPAKPKRKPTSAKPVRGKGE